MTTLTPKYSKVTTANRTINEKFYESLSVKDFGATGNGTTDDTAAIQAAITSAYANEKSLFFPAGTYLISSTITMGNNTVQAATYCHFHGEGNNTIILVNEANVNPFYWQWNDVGVRIDGRILIEKMYFRGPDSFGVNTNSIGLKFYAVQGITVKDCTFRGWYDGEHYKACDIVSRYNNYSQSNYNAVNSSTGAGFTAGNLNSFNTYGGLIANNANYGVFYIGGISPCFFGVNFVVNKTSLIFSSDAANVVTEMPCIYNCYFENDSDSSIVFGGGGGIVRGGVIDGGNIIMGAAVPAITIGNYSNAFGRGRINIAINDAYSGSSKITQTTSVEKIDFYNFNGMPIGDVTPSTGVFTEVSTGQFGKSNVAAGDSIDIMSIGGLGLYVSMTMTIRSSSAGKETVKKYIVLCMGNGTVTGSDITSIVEVYGGGGSPFSLVETANSPTSGTNKLSIKNDDAVTSNYTITYTVENITGTLTLL